MARDPRAQRGDAERLGIAEPAGASAARAAAIAVAGAGAAGWPTSMWMTRPPAASMRAAAAITSITMKGGTSLRAEGVISRFATIEHHVRPWLTLPCSGLAPLLPYSDGFRCHSRGSGQSAGRNSPVPAQSGPH